MSTVTAKPSTYYKQRVWTCTEHDAQITEYMEQGRYYMAQTALLVIHPLHLNSCAKCEQRFNETPKDIR